MTRVRWKTQVAAVLTIRDAGKMTPKGRKQVADWLRAHARWLVRSGSEYGRMFRGRYHYK